MTEISGQVQISGQLCNFRNFRTAGTPSISLFTGTHRRATERHLQYGITVSPATWHRWTCPTLTPDTIYLPRRDGRLSWPRWLVTYRGGLPVRRQSTILIVTTCPTSEPLRHQATINSTIQLNYNENTTTCIIGYKGEY